MTERILKYSWILSGVLLGLSYPGYDPIPTGILAWFAFVPFLLENQKSNAFKIYLVKASLLCIITMSVEAWWVNLYSFSAFLICVFSQFLFILAPLCAFYYSNKRFGWSKALLLLPFLWTLLDFLAHQVPHSLQIYMLPCTQANTTWLVQFADLTGIWGISFWVVMMNSLLALALADRKVKNFAYLFIWLAVPLLYSYYVVSLNPESVLSSSNKKTNVSLIQTNIDSYHQDSLTSQKTYDQIVSLSDSAVKNTQPDLLVLPEAAFPLSLFQDSVLLDFTKKSIAAWQTSVAIGYVEYPDSSNKAIFRNNALVFTPQLAMFWDSLKIKPSDVKVYQKQYGLPFVELTPYFEKTPTLRGSAMERGNEPLVFDYKNFDNENFKVALSICWEQMYPEKIATLVMQNAEFIALMNNDAWFGKTAGAKQLLSFTRLRAIENRRTIARCSNGGISCFIDPFGKIYGKIPWFTTEFSTQEVLCNSKKSFYTKHPRFFLGCVLVSLILLIFYFELFKKNKTV
jgi:apolipoprotein N-acyltransferase